MSKSKILFQMTGSIACFKACALISKLVQAGHHVKVVASPSALQFIGPATLEGLTGEKVVTDLWKQGEAMAHIHLMRWADLIVVAPASAHFINRIASGVGDDLLTTMFLAHDFKKPYLVAPAMNTAMYLHPATQKSIQALKAMGVGILESASGVLACGEFGYGRLLEPDLLLREIESQLLTIPMPSQKVQPTERPRVLITSGGTREPIDGVRVLSNSSTGATGAALTDQLESLGFSVVLLSAEGSMQPYTDGERIPFVSSQDLRDRLRERLAKEDIFAVIHLAAVSDFVLAEWQQDGGSHPAESGGKISSQFDLTLKLKKNPKILPEIRSFCHRDLHLTGFKMTAGATLEERRQAVSLQFEKSRPDWLVHNDTTEINRHEGTHLFHLYKKPGTESLTLNSKAHLAEEFAQEYSKILTNQKGGSV